MEPFLNCRFDILPTVRIRMILFTTLEADAILSSCWGIAVNCANGQSAAHAHIYMLMVCYIAADICNFNY